MFIAVTRVKLPKPALEHMAEAFRRNAGDMKQFAGFLGLELWTNEDTLEAVSRWESREAMEVYSQSSAFQSHHGHGSGAGARAAGENAEAQPRQAAADGGAPQGQGSGSVEYYTGEVLV